MKKTKLIMPVMAVATVASIATPIVVSCGNQQQESVNYVDDKDVVKEKLVTFDQYTVATCTLTGFKTDDARKTHYTSVKVVNQSFASSDVKAKLVTTSEESTDFSIELTIDAVYTNQIITFDLEFTNPNGMKFVSTGYSLEFRVLDWDNHKGCVYSLINGEDVYFPIRNLCSVGGKINPTIMDDTGRRSFKRETFNYPLVFGNLNDGGPTIFLPPGFLAELPSFNQDITIKGDEYAVWVNISSEFMRNCKSFNSKIHFDKPIHNIASNFMAGCTSYNQPFDFVLNESGTTVQSEFMSGCTSFNQVLDFSTTANLQLVTDGFLNNCESFNQPIKLSEKHVDLIPWGLKLPGFMYGDNAFAQTISIPVEASSMDLSFNYYIDFIATARTADMYTKGVIVEYVPVGETAKELETAREVAEDKVASLTEAFGVGQQIVKYTDPITGKTIDGYRNVTFRVKAE